MQLSKVSELVDRQISRAELEKRLIDLYRRLEVLFVIFKSIKILENLHVDWNLQARFNVFEANRHLLFEGELMKQSRKDLQPRYLILVCYIFQKTFLSCGFRILFLSFN